MCAVVVVAAGGDTSVQLPAEFLPPHPPAFEPLLAFFALLSEPDVRQGGHSVVACLPLL